MADFSGSEARRIALAAQGFAEPRPRGRIDIRHLRRVVDRIGLIQIDSVNVAVRSHYMPLFSRLGPYPMSLLDDAVYQRRELFETWAHEASFVPVKHYPLFRQRMQHAEPWRRIARFAKKYPGYLDAVLEEVRSRGALAASELEDPGSRTGPWWGQGKGKVALEWHFFRGAVCVCERRNFARVYDLTERVLPSEAIIGRAPDVDASQRELLLLSARSHGVGTARDLADYYRLPVPRARELLGDLAAEGALELEGRNALERADGHFLFVGVDLDVKDAFDAGEVSLEIVLGLDRLEPFGLPRVEPEVPDMLGRPLIKSLDDLPDMPGPQLLGREKHGKPCFLLVVQCREALRLDHLFERGLRFALKLRQDALDVALIVVNVKVVEPPLSGDVSDVRRERPIFVFVVYEDLLFRLWLPQESAE